GFRLELVVAQPERLPRPEQRSPAKQSYADPVVRVRSIKRVGNLLLVDPNIRIKLVRLEYMIEASRWLKPSIRQLVRLLATCVPANIRHRPGVQHQAANALLCQDL